MIPTDHSFPRDEDEFLERLQNLNLEELNLPPDPIELIVDGNRNHDEKEEKIQTTSEEEEEEGKKRNRERLNKRINTGRCFRRLDAYYDKFKGIPSRTKDRKSLLKNNWKAKELDNVINQWMRSHKGWNDETIKNEKKKWKKMTLLIPPNDRMMEVLKEAGKEGLDREQRKKVYETCSVTAVKYQVASRKLLIPKQERSKEKH